MKLSPLLPICLCLITPWAGNCQVTTPSVGYVRYPSDGVRGVYGLEGNYVVGAEVLLRPTAASFSDEGGLILEGGSLSLVDSKLATLSSAEISDPDGLIRLDGTLETAIAWLPSSHALVHWNGKSFSRTPVPELWGQDPVTSIRKLDASTASLLVSKPDGGNVVRYRLSLRTGELKSVAVIPGASGIAVEDGSRIYCFRERKLSVLSQTGETLQILPLLIDGDLVIERASSRCFHLSARAPGQDWLLHVDGSELRLYQLPGPTKETEAVNGAGPGVAK
jgi:hypothetical protein